MGSIIEKVLEFFEAEEWGYELDPETGTVDSIVRMESGVFGFRIITDEEARVLALVMEVVELTPLESRRAVCEYLVRTNWHLDLGCFHMDLGDGQVVYRSILNLEGSEPTAAMIGHLVESACAAVDCAYPGLMAVTYAGLSPADATARTGIGHELFTPTVQ